MNTQDVVIFDDTDRALMHICFVDKVASVQVSTKDEQYDFDISEELLVGLFAMYSRWPKTRVIRETFVVRVVLSRES